MHQFVQLLVPARSAAVQQRVQRLLLAVLGQAAQPARARPGVHAARLALFERARQAAAAAGLLHQLAAHRHRRAHGQGLLVARLTRHEGRAAAAEAEQRQQQRNAQQHLGSSGKTAETATVINWSSMPIFPLRPARIRTSGVGVPHPQVRAPLQNVSAHDAPSPGHSAPSAAAIQHRKEKEKKNIYISERRVCLPSVMPGATKAQRPLQWPPPRLLSAARFASEMYNLWL